MGALYLACIWIAGISLAVMSVVVPWGVYARYVLGTGSQWPEPLAIQMMVVFTFFAASACYRTNSHIAVTLFIDALPQTPRWLAQRLVDLLLAALSVFMVVWGFELVMVTWHQVIAEFPWLRAGITYLPLPMGGAIMLLFIAERLIAGAPAGDGS